MINTIRLNFTLKNNKLLSDGTGPVYARITLNGERAEFSTKRHLDPKRWDSAAQRATGSGKDALALNAYLKAFELEIYETHRALLNKGEEVTATILKNTLLGTPTKEPTITLMAVFQEHNERIKALIGKQYAYGTYERYSTSLKHTASFLEWKYKKTDIAIKDVDYNFVTSYDFYLRSEKNCSNNTSVKYLKNFKKIILICLKRNLINKDPFTGYRAKLSPITPAFLTDKELNILKSKTFDVERLELVKDIFLFSCFTGLAYVDVKKLSRNEIIDGADKQKWISTSRQKTNTSTKVPLLPPALSILKKYKDHPQCEIDKKLLPVLSNQKMNAYLKEIADLCGIKKSFTYHTARHTFATTVTLANGVPIESVSKMLGHTNIKTTQHYAKILDLKVGQDMKALKLIYD